MKSISAIPGIAGENTIIYVHVPALPQAAVDNDEYLIRVYIEGITMTSASCTIEWLSTLMPVIPRHQPACQQQSNYVEIVQVPYEGLADAFAF